MTGQSSEDTKTVTQQRLLPGKISPLPVLHFFFLFFLCLSSNGSNEDTWNSFSMFVEQKLGGLIKVWLVKECLKEKNFNLNLISQRKTKKHNHLQQERPSPSITVSCGLLAQCYKPPVGFSQFINLDTLAQIFSHLPPPSCDFGSLIRGAAYSPLPVFLCHHYITPSPQHSGKLCRCARFFHSDLSLLRKNKHKNCCIRKKKV